MSSKTPHGLARHAANYGDREMALYLRRSFAASMGYSRDALSRRTVGVVDTASDLNSCHRTVPELIQAVKRGVLLEGGLPLAFPTISLCEPFLSPCSMHYRNLMALDTEAMLTAQPIDAAVLIGGCDKTVPAQLMAAISADVPTVMLVTGPMSANRYMGERLAACTDCRRFWAQYRAGRIDAEQIRAVEEQLAATAGTCGVMGTASTMACVVATLGFMPLEGASAPAVHADRLRIAEAAGRLAMSDRLRRPSQVMSEKAVENAMRVILALGGSTNAVVHLAAIAGRAGLTFDLRRFDAMSEETPVLVDLKPTGEGYMEDFHFAGGLRALLWELRDLLHLDATDYEGRSLAERIGDGTHYVDHAVIRPRSNPISPVGGLVTLYGSLAPDGAILKRSAATPALFEHEAECLVFDGLEDLAERIDREDLPVRPETILILKNAGPLSPYGMPEAGHLPIPQKLARAGVKDMVRLSDCRMSGTAYGTVVLHIAPEAAAGGPLAFVESGDRVRLSVRERRLDLLVDEATLAARRARWTPRPRPRRGWDRLVYEQVLQAPRGADLRFLTARGE
ncbi:MAG: dihydroxy-acid dehydratase [Rhodovarius sp.]|nr:dihydroxy-acid dehydratase [Rhodovarius sp.]